MANISYSGGNRTVFGTTSGDSISPAAGHTGNDKLFGREGDDILSGGAGNDVLFGGAGNDVLSGGSGDDTIAVEIGLGDFGFDRISGGSGFDTVVFQTAQVIPIGSGTPVVVINEAPRGVSVNLAGIFFPGNVNEFFPVLDADGNFEITLADRLGRITDLNDTTATLADIEQFILTAHADRFFDSDANHTIRGGGGDDFISGGGGADVIDGGAGIDTALYRSSASGVSISLLDFGSGGNGSGGEAEGDRLFSIENVHGSEHDDFVLGDGTANVLRGFGGNDVLIGGGGSDHLAGGDGNDTLRGGTGNDRLEGGSGTDTAQFLDWNGSTGSFLTTIRGTITLADGDAEGVATLTSNTFNLSTRQTTTKVIETDKLFGIENVQGSDHADTITGNSVSNILEGRDGNDVLDGGKGADTLNGGDGIDTATFSPSAANEQITVDASLVTGSARVNRATIANGVITAVSELDTLISIENLTGHAGIDRLTGNAGANVLRGEAGNDLLNGGAGADVLNGGDGRDTASYAGSALGVTIDLGRGIAAGGDAEGDTLFSIENLEGSSAGDRLTGDAGSNTIFGGEGNDIIEGGAGADRLDGGAGRNTLSYQGSSGVVVSLDRSLVATGDAIGDETFNFSNLSGSLTGDDVLRGNDAANVINGNGGNDILSGGLGADTLNGGDGYDTADYTTDGGVRVDLQSGVVGGGAAGDRLVSIESVIGGSGDNILRGDGGNNTLSVTGSGTNILAGRGGDDTLTGGGGKDTLQGGEGNDLLSGGTGADVLQGNAGDDALNGDGGADVLDGGNGNDVLSGGLGRDTFVFTGLNAGNDAIIDFQDGIDTIRFNSGHVDSFADLAFAGNGTAEVTIIYGNQTITVSGAAPITLTASDFDIV